MVSASMETLASTYMKIMVDHRIQVLLCHQRLGSYCSLRISKKYQVMSTGKREEVGVQKAMMIIMIKVRIRFKFFHDVYAHILFFYKKDVTQTA